MAQWQDAVNELVSKGLGEVQHSSPSHARIHHEGAAGELVGLFRKPRPGTVAMEGGNSVYLVPSHPRYEIPMFSSNDVFEAAAVYRQLYRRLFAKDKRYVEEILPLRNPSRRRRKNPILVSSKTLRNASPSLFRNFAVDFIGNDSQAYVPDPDLMVPLNDVLGGTFLVVNAHDEATASVLGGWIRLTMTTPGRRNRYYEQYIEQLMSWALNSRNWVNNQDGRWVRASDAPVFYATDATYRLAMVEF